MTLFRSYLFAPGNNKKLLDKVFTAGADAVVLDLEDAVPESEKAGGRRSVAAALAESAPPLRPPAFVRINSLQSEYWRADVDAVVGPSLAGIRVPKVESLEALCRLNDALSAREGSLGLPGGSVRVVATIESARGLSRLPSLARAPRLSGFVFGAADFVADIGVDAASDLTTLFARSALVVASRDRRLSPPVASAFTRLHDDDGLRADTEAQKRLGFFGRSALHPRQVPIIHQVFNPSLEDVAAARGAVAAFESGQRDGRGATQSDGDFLDLATVRRARAVIALAEARQGEAK
jgi:citrate lyase subunit beta/citryl-CoA lyase